MGTDIETRLGGTVLKSRKLVGSSFKAWGRRERRGRGERGEGEEREERERRERGKERRWEERGGGGEKERGISAGVRHVDITNTKEY